MTTSSVPPSLDAPREERFNYGRWLERGGSTMLRYFGALTSSGLVTFVGWLATRHGDVRAQFHVADALTPGTELQTTVKSVLPWLALLTAACIAFMMWRLPPARTPALRKDEDEEFSVDVDLSAGDVASFRKNFQVLLFTWFGFYIVLFAVHVSGEATGLGGLLERSVLDVVNNVSAMLMIGCYVALGAHRRGEARHGYLVVDDTEKSRKLWGAIAGIVILTIFELVYVMIVAAKHDAAHGGDATIKGLDRVFAFVSGITCAVAYSLFAGRLDSRVIGAKMRHIVWLYVYAAIQPAWGIFFHLPAVEAVVLVFQLMLKGWLFLFVSWLLREDVLLFSVQRTREARRIIDDERHEFLERVHGRKHARVSGVTTTESETAARAAS